MQISLALRATTAALMGWAALAHAQAPPASLADQEFARGKALMDQGDVPPACEAFARSYQAEPALGTLLNLAWCHEQQPRLVQAWSEYQRAAAHAEAAGQEKRARFAHQRLEALQQRIPLLQLDLTRKEPGLEVRLDGTSLPLSSLQAPFAIEPGAHTLQVHAPGKPPISHRFMLAPRGGIVHVLVPTADQPPAREQPAPAARGLTPAAWLLGGVGLVALGTGTYFGLRTFSQKDEAQAHCSGKYCDETGLALSRDAERSAVASTVSFAAGAVAFGALSWVLLRGTPETSTTTRLAPFVAPQSAGVSMAGAW